MYMKNIIQYNRMYYMFIIVIMFSSSAFSANDCNTNHFETIISEQRYSNLSIIKLSSSTITGTTDSFVLLEEYQKLFGNNIDDLGLLIPQSKDNIPLSLHNSYNELKRSWEDYEKYISYILDERKTILQLKEDIDMIDKKLVVLIKSSNSAAELLVDNNASSRKIYLATQQIMFIERIAYILSIMHEGKSLNAETIEQFTSSVRVFRRTLDALLYGNKMLGIKKVNTPDARTFLLQAEKDYEEIRNNIANILKNSPHLLEINHTILQLHKKSLTIKENLNELYIAYKAFNSTKSGVNH